VANFEPKYYRRKHFCRVELPEQNEFATQAKQFLVLG
jgi:hypothetical protein